MLTYEKEQATSIWGFSMLGVAVARSVATVSIHSLESGAPREEIVGRIALREGLECGVAGHARQRRLLLPLLAAWMGHWSFAKESAASMKEIGLIALRGVPGRHLALLLPLLGALNLEHIFERVASLEHILGSGNALLVHGHDHCARRELLLFPAKLFPQLRTLCGAGLTLDAGRRELPLLAVLARQQLGMKQRG